MAYFTLIDISSKVTMSVFKNTLHDLWYNFTVYVQVLTLMFPSTMTQFFIHGFTQTKLNMITIFCDSYL